MTFVWLIPLVIFVLFSGVILFQEIIREKALAKYERETSTVGTNSEPNETTEANQGTYEQRMFG